MAWSLVAHAYAQKTTTGINTSGADLIVVSLSYDATVGVSDNKSNTWTALTARSGWNRLYYCVNPTVGSNHTFTLEGISYGCILVAAFSGTGASPYDKENGASRTGTYVTVPSATPTESGSLIVSGVVLGGNSSGPSVDSGMSIIDSRNGVAGSYYGGALAYLVQSEAAALSPTWSWTNSAANAATLAVFKGVSAPATYAAWSRRATGIWSPGRA